MDFVRKLGAILLVLLSVTAGMIGLGMVTGGMDAGGAWGWLLMATTPAGIWLATRVTPEGGTTGYFDENI